MSNIETPTSGIIEKYLNRWDSNQEYVTKEKSLSLLFNDYFPKNDEIGHILLKASALNDFYSTNIYETYIVAKHILSCNVDFHLAKNDIDLVNKIAPVVTSKGQKRNNYSFASKYCSHHKPETYPIYDSYVDKMLWHFEKTNKFG